MRAGDSHDTPILSALRHSILQLLTLPSAKTRSNLSGIPTGLATSKHAPVSDRSRTLHSVLVRPRQVMRAPKSTRRRLLLRLLSSAVIGRNHLGALWLPNIALLAMVPSLRAGTRRVGFHQRHLDCDYLAVFAVIGM